MLSHLRWPALAGSATLALLACDGCKATSGGGGHASPPPGKTLERLTVTSKSFPTNGAIPVDYTCDGADKSPQLTWSAPPAGTKAYAVIVDDPDAPGGDFIHWVAFNMKGDISSLPEAVDVTTLGGVSGTNGFNRTGYAGPCPPKMELHDYSFHVFALDAPVAAQPGASVDELENAMSGHVLGEGVLVGNFSH
jgi:Raf kinase inhibitor-like YbhB/YbcL family protein